MSFVGEYDEPTRAAQTEDHDLNPLEVEQTTDAPSNPRPKGDSELLSSIPPLNEGEQIEHFTIQRLIDRGGFGYVFAAYDEKLERIVALKIPHAREMTESQKHGFLREARLTAKLNHPNIVSVHEVGETDGRIWIASDLIDGHSLVGYMHRHQLSERQIAEFCAAICSGVEAAHKLRIIHRDLKPGNILIGRDGRLYIADFGLAFRDEPSKDNQAYRLAGTLPYMSPEQLDRTAMVDVRSDVYAIGVILYQMLTGERPYQGNRSEIHDLILEARPHPPSNHNSRISADLEAICLKAMQGNPEDRYPEHAEMEADLKRFLAGETPLAYHPSPIKKAARWLRINKWPVATAASILALLVLGLCYVFWTPATSGGDGTTKLPVIISTNPPGASIAIVPFDPATFNPKPDQKILVTGELVYTIDLEPGDYLVEAVSGIGTRQIAIQEVVRTVPVRAVEPVDFGQDARNFSIRVQDGVKYIVWPTINLTARNQNQTDFIRIEGGNFQSGSDVFANFPMNACTLPPFLMMDNEVTVDDYERVMGAIPAKMRAESGTTRISPDLP